MDKIGQIRLIEYFTGHMNVTYILNGICGEIANNENGLLLVYKDLDEIKNDVKSYVEYGSRFA